VLDRRAVTVGTRRVEHSSVGLQELIDWLLTLGETDPSRMLIGIEVPHGPVVESLLERGFQVYAINPKQLDRFRDRYSMAGAKDDQRDAWVLASAVQSDCQAFRAVQVTDPQIVQLRELSRLDGELSEDLTRTANRLRDQLQRYFPQLLRLCPAADEPWLWALLERAATPTEGRQCEIAALEQLLKHARVRRIRATELQAALMTPPLVVAPGTVDAASHHVRVLLPRLQLLHAQRLACAKQLKHLMDRIAQAPLGEGREHHDVTILLSLPGVGVRIGATMLAEAVEPLQTRDYHAMRTLSGLAPVTKASGKRRIVSMRYACNARLRTACYHWARVATQRDATARRHYTTLRQGGHSHPRALRGVADRFLAVFMGMLKSDTLYDKHRPRRATA
jgi:transposase